MRNAMQQYGAVFVCRYAIFMAYWVVKDEVWDNGLVVLVLRIKTEKSLCYFKIMLTICAILRRISCSSIGVSTYVSSIGVILSWSVSSSLGVSSAGELIRAVGQGLEVAAVGGRLNYTLRFGTSFFRVLLYRRILCVLVTQLCFWMLMVFVFNIEWRMFDFFL